MQTALRTLALIGVLAAPSALFAQTDTAPATSDAADASGTAQTPAATPDANKPKRRVSGQSLPGELSMGNESKGTGAPGETYVQETHEDWTVQCVRAKEGKDQCQIYQLLRDKDGNAVSEVSIFALPDGGQAVAGATIITPLETLLTQQVGLRVDSGAAKRYPFSWCSAVGCFARIGLTNADLAAFRKGNEATVTIVPVAAPDQKVELTLSLKGFTAGYDAAKK